MFLKYKKELTNIFSSDDIINIILSFLHPLELILMDTTEELGESELYNFVNYKLYGRHEDEGKGEVICLLRETLTKVANQETTYKEVCRLMKQTKNTRLLEMFDSLLSEEEDFYRWFFPLAEGNVYRIERKFIIKGENVALGRAGKYINRVMLEYFTYTLLKISARKLYFDSDGMALQRSFFHYLLCKLSIGYKSILGEEATKIIHDHCDLEIMST